jgi:type IV secretion system protein VirB11
VAGLTGSLLSREEPILEAELPLYGFRIEGVLPPISRAPAFAIRKPPKKLFPLAAYLPKRGEVIPDPQPESDLGVSAGSSPLGSDIDPESPASEYRRVLSEALLNRSNILVVGSTASAKTSFLGTLSSLLLKQDPSQRILILEDTFEIQCSAANVVRLQTTDTVDLPRLVRTSLRMRPDRIIVGEVRGVEAQHLLDA